MCNSVIEIIGYHEPFSVKLAEAIEMWVKNNEKELIKSYVKSDIESHITNITDISNHIHEIIASIDRAVFGSLSCKDQELIGDCQRSLEDLSNALQDLYMCHSYTDHLETMEWVEDEQH